VQGRNPLRVRAYRRAPDLPVSSKARKSTPIRPAPVYLCSVSCTTEEGIGACIQRLNERLCLSTGPELAG
jgi:hypothetical protein